MAWSALPSGISHLHESRGLHACNKHQQEGAAITQSVTTTPSVVEADHSAGCCCVAADEVDQRMVREGRASMKLTGLMDRLGL